MHARLEVRVASLHPDLHAALLDDWSVDAWDAPPRPLVVPSRTLGRALARDAARRHGAAFGATIRTLGDLAGEIVAADHSRLRRRRLRVEAANWLMRELRHRGARPATSFDPALEVSGFRTALRRSFEDLARAGLVSRRDIERLLIDHAFDLPRAACALLQLMHAYRGAFEATHDDRAALLVRAAAAPAGRVRQALGAPTLWMYGFDALDAPEMRLFDRLCNEADLELRVFVPRTGSGGEDPPLAARLAERPAVTVTRRPARTRHGPDDWRIVAAPSPESEADEVARAILRAAADGLRFESMAVVALQPAALALVARALERAGVPHRSDPGAPLVHSRTGRALLAFLEVARRGIRTEPVLGFLATAPLQWAEWAGVNADPSPSGWERAARTAGVGVGRLDWEAKLERTALEAEESAAELERESAPALQARATAAAARELARVVVALEALVKRLPARAGWGEWVDAVVAVLQAAFAPGRERDDVEAAVERLRALDGLGRTQPLRVDFRDALRGVLTETGAVPARDAVAAVQLGTPSALWGAEFDFVALLGLVESEWPSRRRDDAVLEAPARAALRAVLPEPAAMSSQAARVERERRWFWDACDAARRRLVLSWSRLDPTTGAARLPSALLLELASARLGRRVEYEDLALLPAVERVPLRRQWTDGAALPLHRAECELWLAAGLPAAAARRWVSGLGLTASRGVALERLRQSARFTSADGWLDDDASRRALEARMRSATLSATQLSMYATCPFRYFWRYLLRLEPLDRTERRDLDTLESGRLAHGVLEQIYRDAAARGQRITDLDDDALDVALEQAIDTVAAASDLPARGGSTLLWTVRRRRLHDDLARFLRDERAHGERFVPRDLELAFGRGQALAPAVETAFGRIGMRGIIDRIDVDPSADALRIVDYKTGRPLRTGKDEPRAVQLALYLWVMTAGDETRRSKSEAVFAHVTRRGDFARQRLRGDSLGPGAFEAHVEAIVSGIARGELFAHPGPQAANCRGCDYVRACEARVAPLSRHKAGSQQMAAFNAIPGFVVNSENDAEEVPS